MTGSPHCRNMANQVLYENTCWYISRVWSRCSKRLYAHVQTEKLQTVHPAASGCGNCCFLEQVSHQRGLILLTLFESKAGVAIHAAPVQLRLSLLCRRGLVRRYDANCGNDDEQSISDYGALSHVVRRGREVMLRRWWGWSETRKRRRDTEFM